MRPEYNQYYEKIIDFVKKHLDEFQIVEKNHLFTFPTVIVSSPYLILKKVNKPCGMDNVFSYYLDEIIIDPSFGRKLLGEIKSLKEEDGRKLEAGFFKDTTTQAFKKISKYL